MKTSDKIVHDTKLIIDSVKDTISNNLITASKTGLIDIREDQLSKLVNLVSISAGEGYQKAIRVFQKSVDNHIVSEHKTVSKTAKNK